MIISRTFIPLFAFGVLLAVPSLLLGQAGPASVTSVSGTVTDQVSGSSVTGAQVGLTAVGDDEPSHVALTAADGRFEWSGVRHGEYRIRIEVFGFQPLDDVIDIVGIGPVELRIELVPDAVELDPVLVTTTRPSRLSRAGFYERERRSIGTHLTREEILRRTPNPTVSEVLRTIPGVQVVMGRFGVPARIQLRGGCEPALFIDGSPALGGTTIDEVLSVHDLEGLEVYRGMSVPPQFMTGSGCGAVVAWTRQPGSRAGDAQLSLTRSLFGIGAIISTLIFGL